MKSIVIEVKSNSTQKLLLELAKKLGLKAKIKNEKAMDWEFMPEDEGELELILEKAEKNFEKGKFLTSAQAKNAVKKWK